jgi:hypothetical protein
VNAGIYQDHTVLWRRDIRLDDNWSTPEDVAYHGWMCAYSHVA